MRIDAVLDELRHRLEWALLGQRNYSDGIPVIPDTQLPAMSRMLMFHMHDPPGNSVTGYMFP